MTAVGAEAFEQLYRAHHQAVLRYASRRITGAEAARDVAAEVFEVAWRRRGEIPPGHELAWLYRVAAHRVAYRYRADRREGDALQRLAGQAATPAGTGTAEQIEAAHELADALSALSQLSPDDQQVLLLNAWEGLSGRELGIALGCSTTAAAVRLHRARRRLNAATGTSIRPSGPSAAPAGLPVAPSRTGHRS